MTIEQSPSGESGRIDSLTNDELKEIIDQRIDYHVDQKILEHIEEVSPVNGREDDTGPVSRRSVMAFLTGSMGFGLMSSNAAASTGQTSQTTPLLSDAVANDFSVPEISTEFLKANSIVASNIEAKRINDVRIADNAAEIQQHIDDLSGAGSSHDTVGGGIVKLKRKRYHPTQPIVLKTGVDLVGLQPNIRQGRNNFEWTYSTILGDKIPEGSPIVTTEPGHRHMTVRNVGIHGADRFVHGMKVDNSGQFWVDQTWLSGCGGNGLWIIGGLDCYVTNCNVGGGDLRRGTFGMLVQSENNSVGSGSDDTQLKCGWCRFGSGGMGSGKHGNSAVRMESAQLNIFRCRMNLQNDNDPGVGTVYNNSEGTGLQLKDCRISGNRFSGVHGIVNDGILNLGDTDIEKCDVGIVDRGKGLSRLSNVSINQCLSHGWKIDSAAGQVTNLTVRSNGESGAGHGIYFNGGKVFDTWSAVRVEGNTGWGIKNDSIKSQSYPVVNGFSTNGNGSGAISDPKQIWISGSKGWTNEAHGTSTIASGTTSTSISHGMDDNLAFPEGVMVIPYGSNGSLGSAKTWYVSDPTSGDGAFNLNLDVDPTLPVDFTWYVLGQSALPK